MQFFNLINRRLLGFTSSPLEFLCGACTVLALGFDWVIVVVDFVFFLRVGGVVVEFEVLEIELRIVLMRWILLFMKV